MPHKKICAVLALALALALCAGLALPALALTMTPTAQGPIVYLVQNEGDGWLHRNEVTFVTQAGHVFSVDVKPWGEGVRRDIQALVEALLQGGTPQAMDANQGHPLWDSYQWLGNIYHDQQDSARLLQLLAAVKAADFALQPYATDMGWTTAYAVQNSPGMPPQPIRLRVAGQDIGQSPDAAAQALLAFMDERLGSL